MKHLLAYLIGFSALLFSFLPSCKEDAASPQPVIVRDTVIIVDRDTIYIRQTIRDTIIIRDTIYIAPGSDTTIEFRQNIVLGAQTSSIGSALATGTGSVYIMSEALNHISDVDITYASLFSTSQPHLLSWYFRDDPSTGLVATVPTGARKAYFRQSSLTESEFRFATRSILDGVVVGSSNSQIISIEQGNVYEFQTQNGKKGLLYIQNIVPGFSGSVTLSYKRIK